MSAQAQNDLDEVQGLDLPQNIVELLDTIEDFWDELANWTELNESLNH